MKNYFPSDFKILDIFSWLKKICPKTWANLGPFITKIFANLCILLQINIISFFLNPNFLQNFWLLSAYMLIRKKVDLYISSYFLHIYCVIYIQIYVFGCTNIRSTYFLQIASLFGKSMKLCVNLRIFGTFNDHDNSMIYFYEIFYLAFYRRW